MIKPTQLALGTVQFGLDYGVNNPNGRPALEEIYNILHDAADWGLNTLDTAHAYGNSEHIIGSTHPRKPYSIVTKTPSFQNTSITAEDVLKLNQAFEQSRKHLKITPYGLLIHDVRDLLKPNGQLLLEHMQQLKADGLVKKIGVSVYSPLECETILERFPIDLIQLPMNLYDQRFLRSGLVNHLKQSHIEIHVRSAFLQGLLLMNTLPEYFQDIRAHHQNFLAFCKQRQCSPLSMALSFLNTFEQIDKIIVGANSIEQFNEIKAACSETIEPFDASQFEITEETIIDPRRWEKDPVT